MATTPRLPGRAHRASVALVSLLLAVLAAGLLTVGSASAAGASTSTKAADGYRYWNYFHLRHGTWSFAKSGAGDYVPRDGAVEGYRFGTSTPEQGLPPRADLDKVDFAAVCGDRQAAPGKKRVAVLVDYGTAADSGGAKVPRPRAACAVVNRSASGMQVLQKVADVRANKGFTCAVDGYPASGCGESVKNAHIAADEEPVAFDLPSSDGGSTTGGAEAGGGSGTGPWPIVGAVAAVLVLGGGALGLNRRNRTS